MAEYVTLCERLHNLSDPRDQDHVVYTLPEVLFIVYASILSDYTAWEDMEAFAKHNAAWFRQFFPYQFGFPSYHTLQKVCSLIDSEAFMQMFVDWMSDLVSDIYAHQMGPHPENNDNVIAIDGKALRGSRPAQGKKMVHIVSAYSSERKLILGFTPVTRKSNEITAIPKVLDMLALQGALITSDAMGCQREICQQVIDKEADYLLCVKSNQPALHTKIESTFTEYIAGMSGDSDADSSFAESMEKKQGSI